MTTPRQTALPITTALPELAAALSRTGLAVLQAPPGAGKSTGVPLALLDEPWLAGQRMLVLEPRRLAARAVANRMASLLGESVGATVGYRMRLDTKVGPHTRIEVVTEGILTRQLQRDPALESVGLVIFDEFHERSLQADLGLALTLDVRHQLRPQLRLLVMSATLDGAAVSRLLDDAPLISAPGLSFPVETRYAERDSSDYLDRQVAAAIHRALRDDAGDLLVFLPGAGEIRRVESLLSGKIDAQLHPLYGDLPREAQERAIQPAPAGQRKVVLATNRRDQPDYRRRARGDRRGSNGATCSIRAAA
jgi:ATP-dependent helicase HrpB